MAPPALRLSAPLLGRHGAALPLCRSPEPPMGAESPALSGHHQQTRLLSPSKLGCSHGDPQTQPTYTHRGDTTTHIQPLPPPGAGPATYFLPFLLSESLSRGAPSHPRGLAVRTCPRELPSSRLCNGERGKQPGVWGCAMHQHCLLSIWENLLHPNLLPFWVSAAVGLQQ